MVPKREEKAEMVRVWGGEGEGVKGGGGGCVWGEWVMKAVVAVVVVEWA